MAKQRNRKPTMPAAPAPPEATARRLVAVAIKGNEKWKEWLERGAKHCRFSVSTLVDQAVAEFLKARGFTEEPPER